MYIIGDFFILSVVAKSTSYVLGFLVFILYSFEFILKYFFNSMFETPFLAKIMQSVSLKEIEKRKVS